VRKEKEMKKDMKMMAAAEKLKHMSPKMPKPSKRKDGKEDKKMMGNKVLTKAKGDKY